MIFETINTQTRNAAKRVAALIGLLIWLFLPIFIIIKLVKIDKQTRRTEQTTTPPPAKERQQINSDTKQLIEEFRKETERQNEELKKLLK